MTNATRRAGARTGRILCLSALLAFAAPAAGQIYVGNLAWQFGVPGGGDTGDFIDNNSYLGFLLEGDSYRSPNFSLGFSLGWTELYQETDNAQLELQNGTVGGRAYTHLGILPLLARGRFHIGNATATDPGIRPYVGLHGGLYYIRQLADLGQFEARESAWHFGIAPDAGIQFFTSSGLVITADARYNLPFAAGDYLGGESRSWSYWGFSIGFGYLR